MLIARDKSQLLIVDVQDKLLDAISGKDRVVESCVRLVRAARMLHVPITLSEQYPQGLGPTVDAIREASANAGFVVDKVEFSCLRNEGLRERLHELRRQGRPQVVIGGIEAHVCVLQTAIDLEAQGFEAFVVADAIGSRAKVNSEMVLFEWLERAGTPEFKELQALIK
jgi:nicotinamidase-related amidase